jgi:type I restriction enzyme S subunit
MAAEWLTVPLGELYDFSSGLSKPREEFGFGHGFLSFKDVFYNYFTPNKLEQLVNSTEKEQQSCSIKRGDVFLTRTSETMDELGMSCVALINYERATFNGFTKRLRPKKGVQIVPEYAGYYFRSPSFRREVTAMSSLSTRASLNNEMLARLKMVIPPVSTQERIGSILKSLDDKIELNRRMNATFEATARALFQSWFVDFDPVRAKLDGRQPSGIDPATAALFPDSFEESPLGHVPKGWEVKMLGDIGTNSRRGVQPGDLAPNTPYIALEHMPRRCIALGDWDDSAEVASGKSAFKKGQILFGKLRPYFHKVGVAPFDGVCSTDILVLAPKSPEWFGFLLGHASSDELIQFTDLASTGTKMPRTNWSDISSFKVVLPPKPLAAAFTKLIEPMVERMTSNLFESRNLATLRDTLLPNLLSGELSLN